MVGPGSVPSRSGLIRQLRVKYGRPNDKRNMTRVRACDRSYALLDFIFARGDSFLLQSRDSTYPFILILALIESASVSFWCRIQSGRIRVETECSRSWLLSMTEMCAPGKRFYSKLFQLAKCGFLAKLKDGHFEVSDCSSN